MWKKENKQSFITAIKYLAVAATGIFLLDIVLILLRISDETRRIYKLVLIIIFIGGWFFYSRWKKNTGKKSKS